LGIPVAWDIFQSVQDWYHGNITGKRCVTNIANSVGSIAGGVSGVMAGATVGTWFCPGFGTVLGAVFGAVVGSYLVRSASDCFWRTLFSLPKEVAAENAFKKLGLSYSASEQEATSKYRTLSLKCHPDKQGGSTQAFQDLHVAYCLVLVHINAKKK